jgi:hypothetical protein
VLVELQPRHPASPRIVVVVVVVIVVVVALPL